MINTTGSLISANRTGLLDVTSYIAAISGSCWALSALYSIADGNVHALARHLKSRIQEDFFDPATLDLLTSPPTNSYLLAGPVIKQAGKSGDLSLVDAYGLLVSSRLLVPDDLTALSAPKLKVSAQQALCAAGRLPLPIYNLIRHDIPQLDKLAQLEETAEAKPLFGRKKSEEELELVRQEREALLQQSTWQWFELTPFEVCHSTARAET